MRFLLATTTLLSLVSLASVAAADTGEEPLARTKLVEPEAKPTNKEWYGFQILVSDAATIVSSYALGSMRAGELAAMNLYGGYLLASPIIHGVHGNYAQAAASLGLRVALPVTGGLVGCNAYGHEDEWFGCLPGAVLGMLIGLSSAVVIDATALAYADAKPRPRAFEVMPAASMNRTGATFGVQGTF